MLRRAVGGLQRNTAVRECGANLNDDAAVARTHALERGERAMDVPEICHLGDATVLASLHLAHRREDGGHGVVDPHVDRTEFALQLDCSTLHRLRISDIGLEDERPPAPRLDIESRCLEPLTPPRNEANT